MFCFVRKSAEARHVLRAGNCTSYIFPPISMAEQKQNQQQNKQGTDRGFSDMDHKAQQHQSGQSDTSSSDDLGRNMDRSDR